MQEIQIQVSRGGYKPGHPDARKSLNDLIGTLTENTVESYCANGNISLADISEGILTDTIDPNKEIGHYLFSPSGIAGATESTIVMHEGKKWLHVEFTNKDGTFSFDINPTLDPTKIFVSSSFTDGESLPIYNEYTISRNTKGNETDGNPDFWPLDEGNKN